MIRILILITGFLTFISARSVAMTLEQQLTQADSLFKSRNYEKARENYQQIYSLSQSEKNRSTEVEALSQIARCYLIQNDKTNAKEWLTKAGAVAAKDYPLGWSRYLGVRGRLEWKEDDLRKAFGTFKEMFEFCQQNNLTERSIDAIHMIAIVGTSEEQIEWGLKGVDAAEKAGVNQWLGPLWNNLAITYSDIKDWDKCVDAYKQARDYHWRFGDEINKLYADYQIGWALRMKGDHDQALTWLRPALAWAERLDNNDVMGQASQDIGEIVIAKGEKAKGIEYLQRAVACFEKEGYPQNSPELYQKLQTRIGELTK